VAEAQQPGSAARRSPEGVAATNVGVETREFEKLLTGQGAPPEQAGLRDPYECQLRCLKLKAHKCRWHPRILEWCAEVWRRDRGAYEQVAYGNVLLLPHPDTIRKRCASALQAPGHNMALYARLGEESATKGCSAAETHVVLKFDEINIQSGLAWRKVRTAPLARAPRLPHPRAALACRTPLIVYNVLIALYYNLLYSLYLYDNLFMIIYFNIKTPNPK
jgi:hypothetical protein